jgi:hypothetical protein
MTLNIILGLSNVSHYIFLSLSFSLNLLCACLIYIYIYRWWFPTTNEQYRIRGRVIFVGNGQFPLDQDAALKEARNNQWIRLTDASRDSFLCQKVLGEAYDSSSNKVVQSDAAPKGGKDASTGEIIVPPPDNFLLMLLLPKHVDYLKLGEINYRQVDERNEKDGTWSSQRVNP